jgi:thiosulfate dehydrogenase [quinone] large subunit
MATGAVFLAEGCSKVAGPFIRGKFAEQASQIAAKSWPVWSRFLLGVVLPNAAAVGWLVAVGELAVGIGLLAGLWTRAACAGGALLVFTFLLGQFWAPGGAWYDWITAGITSKFALLLLVLLASADAGKTWGLDGRPRRGRAIKS